MLIFILSDINLLLKIVGIQTYIDLTLDNEEVANDRLEAVKYIFELYSSRNIGCNRKYYFEYIGAFAVHK